MALILVVPIMNANAMHIMEGYLPPVWSISWGVLCIPFIVLGFLSIKKKVSNSSRMLLILAMCGAFAFVLSSLKIPSVTGSCSHPTGVGLGTVLFGPLAMSVIGVIVLLFQAILLAHGGITTLGANTFSMAIAGPFIAYGVYILCKRVGVKKEIGVFFAAFLGDIFTYMVTSGQLALAFPDATGGVIGSLVKFLGIFAITQLPLAMIEGLLTVIVYNGIQKYCSDELNMLSV
nr:energy-coupling factor ABC transporter permease [Clostridium cylindrosporum]